MTESNSTKLRPKIVFIDDEESILSSFSRMLRKEDYEVHLTLDPERVFQLVNSERIALVVSDQRMPIMDGVSVLTRVRELSPDTVRIMLTGYADMQAAVDAVNSGNIFRFLSKPWKDQELRAALAQAVAHHDVLDENRRLQAITALQNQALVTLNRDLESRVQLRTQDVTRLNKRLERHFLECVRAMGGLAEISGSLPKGHAKRVARIAGAIAKKMGCSTSECLDIQVAGFLHDIGKVGPAHDAAESWANHGKKGFEIARLVPGLDRAAEIILHHHDRPDQKSGIPVGAQIIAVSDAFDKLLFANEEGVFTAPHKVIETLLLREGELSVEVVMSLAKHLKEAKVLEQIEYEVEFDIHELRPGMVTSKALYFKDGRMAIGVDCRLDQGIIERLWRHHLETPVVQAASVYRDSVPMKAQKMKAAG